MPTESVSETSKPFRQSKLSAIAGFLKTFFWLSREEWREMDHKIPRLVLGGVTFIAMALFWLYFLRGILPQGIF